MFKKRLPGAPLVFLYYVFIIVPLFANECALVDTMIQRAEGEMSENVRRSLYTVVDQSEEKETTMPHYCGEGRMLYELYPQLKESLAHITLGDLPTPITHLANLEKFMQCGAHLYMKRDDLTGRIQDGIRSFGGNKIRKLEFLLGDALSMGARSVMTLGAIGSNHVVATAVSCKQVGLRCSAMLIPQDVADVVKRNMLLMYKYDVAMTLNPNVHMRNMQAVCSFVQSKYKQGDMPYFIPTGGSCPVGIVGFVNAVFELREQIEEGLVPEPDYIYSAMGSVGTTVGLTLGVRVAGLHSQVIGVAVEPDDSNNPFAQRILKLLQETNALLHEKDNSFPLFEWAESDIHIRFDCSGPDYGVVTKEAIDAIDLVKKVENIQLDTTYTGKACAAVLHDLETGVLAGKNVLFWNTFCSDVEPVNLYHEVLPVEFHRYFVT